jgi:hypothetical protein
LAASAVDKALLQRNGDILGKADTDEPSRRDRITVA